MEDAQALSAVVAIHPRLSVLPPLAPPESGARWWLGAALLLNGTMVGITGVGLVTTREQLERMGSRSQQHAQAAEQQAEGMRALEARLVDVRRAVSSHAREESLFLKMLILKPGLDPALGRRIAAAIQANCLLYGQDPNLVLAIIAIESSFNPNAVSPVGAVGLMQVMPFWKKTLGLKEELRDPEGSIRAGVQVLAHYGQMYRDEALTLTAYNRGPGAVDFALANGTSPANGYAEKVLSTWQRLKDIDVAGRP